MRTFAEQSALISSCMFAASVNRASYRPQLFDRKDPGILPYRFYILKTELKCQLPENRNYVWCDHNPFRDFQDRRLASFRF